MSFSHEFFLDTPHCSRKLENVRLKTLSKTSCDATYHGLNKFSSRHAYLRKTCLVNALSSKASKSHPIRSNKANRC